MLNSVKRSVSTRCTISLWFWDLKKNPRCWEQPVCTTSPLHTSTAESGLQARATCISEQNRMLSPSKFHWKEATALSLLLSFFLSLLCYFSLLHSVISMLSMLMSTLAQILLFIQKIFHGRQLWGRQLQTTGKQQWGRHRILLIFLSSYITGVVTVWGADP